METINFLIGNALLLIGLTGICYTFLKNKTEPLWFNLFRAMWIPIWTLIIINIVIVATSPAMDWSEGRATLEEKINNNYIPGEINYWKMSQDEKEFNEINETLSHYKFTKNYTLNEFDCSDMSKITYAVLEKAGYEPYLAYKINNEGSGHSFLMVSVEDGMIAVEATNQSSIGVATQNKKYYDCYVVAGIEAYDFAIEDTGINATTLPAAMSQYMSSSLTA